MLKSESRGNEYPILLSFYLFTELNLDFSLVLLNLLLQDKQKIFMAKYYCVRLHALFGAALAAGLVVSRMVTKGYVPRLIFS